MDIGAISLSNLQNSSYIPLATAGRAQENLNPDPKTTFADLLNQSAKSQNGLLNAKDTANRAPVIDKKSKLYQQCEALESFLFKNILDGMRKTGLKSNLIDTGLAGDMYEDMLYDKYADELSKNTDYGLAEDAYLELTGQRGKMFSLKG
jgi:flagellar protein FlgJ